MENVKMACQRENGNRFYWKKWDLWDLKILKMKEGKVEIIWKPEIEKIFTKTRFKETAFKIKGWWTGVTTHGIKKRKVACQRWPCNWKYSVVSLGRNDAGRDVGSISWIWSIIFSLCPCHYHCHQTIGFLITWWLHCRLFDLMLQMQIHVHLYSWSSLVLHQNRHIWVPIRILISIEKPHKKPHQWSSYQV